MEMTSKIPKQQTHFELLSSVMGFPVCIFRGKGHFGFFKDKIPYHQTDKIVSDRLRFNSREIIIESDTIDWDHNFKYGNKIKEFLDNKNIPYMLIITGGRGMRFHVFLDKYSELPQQKIFFVYAYLCHCIGLDWQKHGVPENKSVNHLLGCISKLGKFGGYASWYDKIPITRPKLKLSEIKFPEKIELWKIPEEIFDESISFGESIPKKIVSNTMNQFRYRVRGRGIMLVLK